MVAARVVHQFIKCLAYLPVHIALCQYHISVKFFAARCMPADASYHVFVYPHHEQGANGCAPHGMGAQVLVKEPAGTGGGFYFLQHAFYRAVFGRGTIPACQAANGFEVQVEIAIAKPAKQKATFLLPLPGYDVEAVRRQWNIHHAAGFASGAAQHQAVSLHYQVGGSQPHQVAHPQASTAAIYEEVFALLQVGWQLLMKSSIVNQKCQLLRQQYNGRSRQYGH